MHRPVTTDDLLAFGPFRRLGSSVTLLPDVDSTNAFLKQRVASTADGAIVAAEYQTAGRGRQGRRWVAPRGSSVLLSVMLIEPASSPLMAYATVLAALAACEAIERATGCAPGLRWPNDLVAHEKKLGGVLVETAPLGPRVKGERRRAVIIGVGINCLQQPGHFSPDLASRATSLEIECPHAIDRAAVAGRLVERLDALLTACACDAAGWEWLAGAWRARCRDVGRPVALVHDGGAFSGRVLEIADNGDLVVQLDEGGGRRFRAATTTRLWTV
jgi:BirA family transcriptional regulator, biotin operon repressor / biotin---[acetyl-CoA-carboxylase] ligase